MIRTAGGVGPRARRGAGARRARSRAALLHADRRVSPVARRPGDLPRRADIRSGREGAAGDAPASADPSRRAGPRARRPGSARTARGRGPRHHRGVGRRRTALLGPPDCARDRRSRRPAGAAPRAHLGSRPSLPPGRLGRTAAGDDARSHRRVARGRGVLTRAEARRLVGRTSRAGFPSARRGARYTATSAPRTSSSRPTGASISIDNERVRIDFLDFDLARTWTRWPMSVRKRARFERRYATWGRPVPVAAGSRRVAGVRHGQERDDARHHSRRRPRAGPRTPGSPVRNAGPVSAHMTGADDPR